MSRKRHARDGVSEQGKETAGTASDNLGPGAHMVVEHREIGAGQDNGEGEHGSWR